LFDDDPHRAVTRDSNTKQTKRKLLEWNGGKIIRKNIVTIQFPVA